jgi:hypothetical protein
MLARSISSLDPLGCRGAVARAPLRTARRGGRGRWRGRSERRCRIYRCRRRRGPRLTRLVDDGAEGAELALDGGDLADDGGEDVVLGRSGSGSSGSGRCRAGLEGAVDAAVALLHAGGVPGDVEVEEVGAGALEVDALAGGVGGEQDADWGSSAGPLKARWTSSRASSGMAPWSSRIRSSPRSVRSKAVLEQLAEVALGVEGFGEDEDAAVAPGSGGRPQGRRRSSRGAHVAADPGDEREDAGVGEAAAGGGFAEHGVEQVAGERRRAGRARGCRPDRVVGFGEGRRRWGRARRRSRSSGRRGGQLGLGEQGGEGVIEGGGVFLRRVRWKAGIGGEQALLQVDEDEALAACLRAPMRAV